MRYALFLGNAGHDSGGPEVYETELVRALSQINCADEFHLMCLFPGARKVVGVEQPNFVYHDLPPAIRALSMTTTLPFKLSRIRPRSVHSTFMPAPLTFQPHLMTLVCSSMFDRPDFYPTAIRLRLQALTTMGIKTSRLLLCISEMVKNRFAERFRVPEERLAVVHLGVNPRFRPRDPNEVREYLDDQGIRDPYFLFCGRWEMRKNLLGIIEAFAKFKRETKLPHKLVLTGKRTWVAAQAEERIRALSLESEVIDHGKTPIADLPFLYAGADALVYASFFESFGLPIVEAMACNTPVITSNLTAMPEIAGGAALLVDPHRPESISEAMYKVASDKPLADSMRIAGLRRAQSFTWKATAQATLEAYRRVADLNANFATQSA